MKTLKTMKIKYLVAALTGVAMASCSQDDLNLDQPQVDAKSPISFIVHSDVETRAELNGAQVTFEAGDLMSLYQDGTFGSGLFKDYDNAIFEGKGDGGLNLEFTSRNMVKAGNAIMVYPADTVPGWDQASNLAVSIPAMQPKGYADFIPQVSDFMEIKEYKDADYEASIENNNTAGYGRKYDIRLKPLGTLVRLTLNAENKDAFDGLDVDPIEFTGVEFKETDETATPFYTTVVLKDNGEESTLKSNVINPEDYEMYEHFKYQVDVDFSTAPDGKSIGTEDIRNGNVAHLVMLPNTEVSTTNPSIIVKTTYGKVTVSNTDARVFTSSDNKWTVKDGINFILGNSWKTIETAGSKFLGANAGVSAQRGLTFDLEDLEINGTEVKTSKQIIDLIKVYNALRKTEDVTLILKADKKEFILTDEAMNALAEVKNFALDATTNRNSIVIEKGVSLDLFNKTGVQFNDGAEVPLTVPVDLVLRGAWTIDQKESFTKVASLTNEGTLTVTNTTGLLSGKPFGKALTVAKDAVLSISGKVYMGAVTALEESTINIPESNELYATGSTILIGTVNNYGVLSSRATTGAGVSNFGTINCLETGEVSVVKDGTATFNNAGVINAAENSVVYITNNQIAHTTGDATYEPAIDETDADFTYKGAIVLAKRDGEVTVQNYTHTTPGSETPGYIKYTETVNAAEVAVDLSKYRCNYLTIDVKYSSSSNVTLSNIDKGKMDYLEIKGNTAQVVSIKEFTIVSLIVQSDMRYLSGNGTLNVTNTWVKGSILHGNTIVPGAINASGGYNSGIYGEETDLGFEGVVRSN